jgi:hypothetical protein
MFSSRLAMGAPQWGAIGHISSDGTQTLNIQQYLDLYGAFLPTSTHPATTNAHAQTLTTPYGPGFSITCTDSDVAIWDNTEKDILLQPTAPRNGTNSDAVGTIVQYTT